ncbi:MAG: oxygen-independent coproporphyrinogen III oxidase [Elusimicrobiota bacterium]
MNISLDLLKKYNVQGPRYTSYPPAPSWSAGVGVKEYEDFIQKSNASQNPVPLSLYFHLPFCESLCYFCGCTTVITGKNRSAENPYLQHLHTEIERLGSKINKNRPVVQFHLGGGTPTYLEPQNLEALLKRVRQFFAIDPDCEMGVEIDPRVTNKKHLMVLKNMGFNRLSMGVQDFNPEVQKAINRIQPFDLTKALVEEARVLGFKSINIDLIYGLPHQTENSFSETINQILDIQPDRLAVYSYAHVPWMKKHQELFAAHLPNEKTKFSLLLLAMKKFSQAGFEYIGMDHFAKPNDELAVARKNRTLWRNFQGYTTKAGTDLLGLGMSSIGCVNGAFFQNERELKTYQDAISGGRLATVRGFLLSKDDKLRSRVIQSLLCHAHVSKAEIERDFQIKFDEYFSNSLIALEPLVKDGLLNITKEEIQPTNVGRVFLRNIAMPFDAYLPKEGEKRVFSKTV